MTNVSDGVGLALIFSPGGIVSAAVAGAAGWMSGRSMLLAVEVARARGGFGTLLESKVSGVTVSVALLVGVAAVVSVALLHTVGAFVVIP